MKKIILCVCATLAAVALLSWYLKPANMLFNGDFELDALPVGKLIATNRLAGWEVEGGSIGLLRLGTNTVAVFNGSTGKLKQRIKTQGDERYISQMLVRKKPPAHFNAKPETYLLVSAFSGDVSGTRHLAIDVSPPPHLLKEGWIFFVDNCSVYKVSDSDVGARMLLARPTEVRFVEQQ